MTLHPIRYSPLATRLSSVDPALALSPLRVRALPVVLPVARRTDAVDAGWAGDRRRFGRVEHHQWPRADAGLVERLPQQPAVGADRLVRGAEMLLGAVLDGAHGFAGPLVVHVDVGAHAGIGRVLLLVGVETVIVALVLARHIVGHLVKLEPLAAHLVLVHRR